MTVHSEPNPHNVYLLRVFLDDLHVGSVRVYGTQASWSVAVKRTLVGCGPTDGGTTDGPAYIADAVRAAERSAAGEARRLGL